MRNATNTTYRSQARCSTKRLLFSLAVTAAILSRLASAAGLLDLTLAQPKDSVVLESPSVHFPYPPPTPFPVEVTITNLWPAVATHYGRINADVLIRNVGKEPIAIPASQDFANVPKAGNKDRRILGIQLELAHPHGSKPIRFHIGVAVGSASVSGSMIILAPQETLLIRAGEMLSETWKWHESGLQTDIVAAKAIVREEFIEDEQYTVKNWSQEAVSRNKTTFTWTRTGQ